MNTKKKVAIFIDYCIRVPNFEQAYSAFKNFLFQDTFGLQTDTETANDEEFKDTATVKDPIRFYWQAQLEDINVMNFYIKQNVSKINNIELKGDFQKYFFNEEHFKKFIEDYSFNLYSDGFVPSKKDLQLINICQGQLFDVYLFDRVYTSRKVPNTLHFISKNTLFIKSINFIGYNEEFNKEDFIGVWEPEMNKEQINKEGSDVFLNWLKDLEAKNK